MILVPVSEIACIVVSQARSGTDGAHETSQTSATTSRSALGRTISGEAMIASLFGEIVTSSWMRTALRYGPTALAIFQFLLSLRRSGRRIGKLAEQVETTEKANDVQRRMLEAAARRPRDRDELAERLRDGRY